MGTLWTPLLLPPPFSLSHTQMGQMGPKGEAMRLGVGGWSRRPQGKGVQGCTKPGTGGGWESDSASFAGLSPFNSFIVITLKMPLYIE